MIEHYTREEIEELKSCLDMDNFAAKLGHAPMKHLFTEQVVRTTQEAAFTYAFWVSQFRMHQQIVIVEDTHRENLVSLELFIEWYDRLQPLLRADITRWNKSHSPTLVFENHSQIVMMCNPIGLKGRSCSLLLISDRITGKKLEEVQYMAIPSIRGTDSKLIYFT
jgi:hypothetical protein